jgi:hypothetical protein
VPCIVCSRVWHTPKYRYEFAHPTISVILEPSSESFLQIKAIAFQIHMRFPCPTLGSSLASDAQGDGGQTARRTEEITYKP